MYKGALFFDYDGTLVDRHENIYTPTPTTLRAIELLQSKGYLVCLATGRSYSYIPESGIDFDCMITANGGYTFHKNEVLLKVPFDKELLAEMFEYFDKNNMVCISEHEKNCYVNFYEDENFLEKIKSFNLVQSQFKPYNGEDEEFYKLLVIYHRHEEFEAFDEKFGSRVSATLPHLGLTSCDVNPLGVTKADGIKAIVEHFGIDFENTYAFGDGGNDLGMVRFAGMGYIMANASEAVRAQAPAIAPSNAQDGLAQVVEKWLSDGTIPG